MPCQLAQQQSSWSLTLTDGDGAWTTFGLLSMAITVVYTGSSAAGTTATMGLFSKKKAATDAAEVGSADIAAGDAPTARMSSTGGGVSSSSDKNPFVTSCKLAQLGHWCSITRPPARLVVAVCFCCV